MFLSVIGLLLFGCVIAEYDILHPRLPNDTKPISYNLHIVTNIHNIDTEYEFNGTVVIRILVVKQTNTIVLHSSDLNIVELGLVDYAGYRFSDLQYEFDEGNGTLLSDLITISSSSNPLELQPGKKYNLSISYTGILYQDLAEGFYTSLSQDADGKQVWIASTDFQPTAARNAFPCFDEPALKAKFSISITHGNNFSAISNMPAVGQPTSNANGMVTTTFMETPLMSTYILAFVVSNYEHTSSTYGNITQRVFYPPGFNGKGNLTIKVSADLLNTFSEYFDIPYSLPKMDHLSVSNRLGRAMENWGLTIYKDEFLIGDVSTSKMSYYKTAMSAAHEMAHQWFGNLVTHKWWTYAWLNEGFATFYSFKMLNQILPNFEIMDIGLCYEFSRYPWTETESQPLTYYRRTDSEIEASLSANAYFKAALILRMFENAFTEKTFKKGVINYLKQNQYSSVTEDDLLNNLQMAVTEDRISDFKEFGTISLAIKSWTHQDSIPLITVTRDYYGQTFTIEQSSFDGNTSDDKPWWIPITFATSNSHNFQNTTPDFILKGVKRKVIDTKILDTRLLSFHWLLLNKEQIGLYRVNYDEENWKLIAGALFANTQIFPSQTKAQLIRDAGSLYEKNLVSPEVLLNLLSYLKDETDPIPWNEALRVLQKIHSNIKNTEILDAFNKYGRNIVGKVFRKVGFKPGGHDTALSEFIRPNLIDFACNVELRQCIKNVQAGIVHKFQSIPSSKFLDPILFCQGIKYGTKSDFFAIEEMLFGIEDYERIDTLAMALSCTKDEELLRRLLLKVFRDPDGTRIFRNIIKSSPTAFDVALNLLDSRDNRQICSQLWECEMFKQLQNDNQKTKVLNACGTGSTVIESCLPGIEKRLNLIRTNGRLPLLWLTKYNDDILINL